MRTSPPRLLVLLDEPCLLVFPSAAHAAIAIEGIDVEDDLRAVFDEDGVPYRVEWTRPNTRSRFSVENGDYRFVASGTADPSSLLTLLGTHPQARDSEGSIVNLSDLAATLRTGSAPGATS